MRPYAPTSGPGATLRDYNLLGLTVGKRRAQRLGRRPDFLDAARAFAPRQIRASRPSGALRRAERSTPMARPYWLFAPQTLEASSVALDSSAARTSDNRRLRLNVARLAALSGKTPTAAAPTAANSCRKASKAIASATRPDVWDRSKARLFRRRRGAAEEFARRRRAVRNRGGVAGAQNFDRFALVCAKFVGKVAPQRS